MHCGGYPNNDISKARVCGSKKVQEISKAAAAKKKPTAAARQCGAPRTCRRWDGEHELVESGVSHFVGACVPDVLDAGGEHEDDESAPKKHNVYRSFQKTSWLLLLTWLFAVANDSAVACSRAGVGCPGCADCSKMFGSLCMSCSKGPEKGPCENRAATSPTMAAAAVSGLLLY